MLGPTMLKKLVDTTLRWLKLNFPPILVAALPGRPRQMTLAEGPGGQARGWDNGIGGYQTHTMLEHTRIAAQGNGSQEGN